MLTVWCRYAFVPCLLYSVWSQGPASLTFSRNPVYKGSELEIICSFSSKVTLANVTIDAFNGTRRAGFLYCSEKTGNTSGTGVLSEARFTGCPGNTQDSGIVSVSMRASPALELVYNCTVYAHDISTYFSLRSNSTGLEVKDPVVLAFSDNPVYNGSQLTITCSFSDTLNVTAVTIEAFSVTRVPASQCYCIHNDSCNCSGVFSEGTILNYPALARQSYNVSVSMLASPMLELNYSCTIRANDNSHSYSWTSDSLQLEVRVQPSQPKFIPEQFVFNESQHVAVLCQSHSGKPPADLTLTVSTTYKSLNTSVGSESVSLNLSVPRSWHNAVVLCNVTNYNMTAINSIVVNHIAALSDRPTVVSTNAGNKTLNCSAAIEVFPEALYQWSIPADAISSYQSSGSSPSITVQRGQSGLFNCSATNNVTLKTVIVTYNVSNIILQETEIDANLKTTDLWIWLLPLVGFALIVIILVLCILYKRGNFRKGQRIRKPSKSQASRMSSNYDSDQGEDIAMTENLIYEGLCDQRRDNFNDGRLLIVAEGAVANVKHKILPTTILVEYCDQSCSLDDILAKVRLAISSSSRPAFGSVAFLLRRSQIGSTLSEVDRTVLTFRGATGGKGKKLRDFLTDMVNMCLDKEAGSTRLDILNYGNNSSANLSKALTDLLKVTVTVSGDLFGMEVVKPQARGCTTVGDDYFDRDRLDEVIYADVAVPTGEPHSTPRKHNDQVLYSEIALKM